MSKIIRLGKNLVVNFPKESDHHNLMSLNDKLEMEIIKKNIKNVIFDFSDVSFIDSSAIGLIVSKSRMVESLGGKTALCGAKGHILKVLKTCAPTGINRIFNDVAKAVESFEPNA